ncbi:Dimethylmenaquinone methyltransferase [Bradyrhizobium sp. STM 3843]|uniref:RraA family protein n=1 Tax=Bradyrhizobium sp. STM 3843 TaxID=551947 RepID=UPI0002403481|nr:RraA family protein [Bradyrhizobium sp. STM 3843]CCE10761.1 Dimethylmenaquinone methyltransferase [Bradyrhizobium sp. STM 3843]
MTETKVWPPGYRINPRVEVMPKPLIAGFRGVPTAHAGDSLGRSIGAVGLRSYHNDLNLMVAGPAITVRVRPGDNLMIHQAIAMAQPGDVLVVDAGGDVSQAVIGGLMRTSAITRRIAAFVIDGAVRDLAEWAQGGIACYARGHTHRGPTKDGPGEVNVPIACAGMAVCPGDLVICDADGVIAVPAAEADALLPRVKAHAKRENEIRAANAAGTTDPERFNALLRSKGCPV